MKKTICLQFRVTRTQHEMIHNNARAKGYTTTSQYLRDLALEKGLIIENIITETYKIVREIKEMIQTKNPPPIYKTKKG